MYFSYFILVSTNSNEDLYMNSIWWPKWIIFIFCICIWASWTELTSKFYIFWNLFFVAFFCFGPLVNVVFRYCACLSQFEGELSIHMSVRLSLSHAFSLLPFYLSMSCSCFLLCLWCAMTVYSFIIRWWPWNICVFPG